MRSLPVILALWPAAALAEDIPLSSDVSAVTLYPGGASVTRAVPFSVPAGDHALILTDLPGSTPMGSVRVAVDGAVMGSVSTRTDFVPPRSAEVDAAIEEAEAEIERIEGELRDGRARVEEIRLVAEAARARATFLRDLGRGDGVAEMETGALRELVTLVGDETLDALETAHAAEQKAKAAERDLQDVEKELDRAKQALEALVPETEDRAMLAVSVSTQDAAEGTLTLRYTIDDAGWQPAYDLRLDRAEDTLAIERAALIRQDTGENWTDTRLSLSTVRPSERTEPAEVRPVLRRIVDPDAPEPVPRMRSDRAGEAAGLAAAEAPAPVQAAAKFAGLSVSYDYPEPVSVASGADTLRLALGTLETDVDIVAEAVPLADETAFLVTRFTNDGEELILPTKEARFYRDGRFIGRRAIELIPAGGEAELAFGPIDGLRLGRTVLDRSEGDRGVVSRSTERAERVRIEVENLTGEAWPMRVIDRVPYSEQEDLEITWQADPRVAETDIGGRRGVLAWEFGLPAGATRTIDLNHTLEWPEGMVLR